MHTSSKKKLYHNKPNNCEAEIYSWRPLIYKSCLPIKCENEKNEQQHHAQYFSHNYTELVCHCDNR